MVQHCVKIWDICKLVFFCRELLASFQTFFITLHFVSIIYCLLGQKVNMTNLMSMMYCISDCQKEQIASSNQMNMVCFHKKCIQVLQNTAGTNKISWSVIENLLTQDTDKQDSSLSNTLSSQANILMHTDFPITESSHSGLYQPCHVGLSLEMTSAALYISESVQIPRNHYWASRQSWCKLGSTATLWNRTHWRGKKSQTAERQLQQKGSKTQTMWRPKTLIVCSRAAQINCQIVTDMMADHLGQNDVHDAPFTAACLCPFVFMPSLKQRVCQFRGPKNWCVFRQAPVAHRPILHQQVGRRNLSNIAAQKYVTVEQGKHRDDSLWIPLAPQTQYAVRKLCMF